MYWWALIFLGFVGGGKLRKGIAGSLGGVPDGGLTATIILGGLSLVFAGFGGGFFESSFFFMLIPAALTWAGLLSALELAKRRDTDTNVDEYEHRLATGEEEPPMYVRHAEDPWKVFTNKATAADEPDLDELEEMEKEEAAELPGFLRGVDLAEFLGDKQRQATDIPNVPEVEVGHVPEILQPHISGTAAITPEPESIEPESPEQEESVYLDADGLEEARRNLVEALSAHKTAEPVVHDLLELDSDTEQTQTIPRYKSHPIDNKVHSIFSSPQTNVPHSRSSESTPPAEPETEEVTQVVVPAEMPVSEIVEPDIVQEPEQIKAESDVAREEAVEVAPAAVVEEIPVEPEPDTMPVEADRPAAPATSAPYKYKPTLVKSQFGGPPEKD